VKPEVRKHLDRAGELLEVAREVLRLGHPADSVSRSYYAAFHAATAMLLELGIERSSHHAVWAAFGEQVTARGLLDARYHRAGLDLLRARSSSDYLAEPEDTQEDAAEALGLAQEFASACRSALEAG